MKNGFWGDRLRAYRAELGKLSTLLRLKKNHDAIRYVYPPTASLFTIWSISEWFLVFGYYEWSCDEHSCTDFCGNVNFNSLIKLFRSIILGHMIDHWIFLKLSSCFPERLFHFLLLPGIHVLFTFSTSSPAFAANFFKSLSDRCVVLFHCDFDLHFSMTDDVEHLFMCLSCVYLWWNICSHLEPFFQVDFFFYCWVLNVLYTF